MAIHPILPLSARAEHCDGYPAVTEVGDQFILIDERKFQKQRDAETANLKHMFTVRGALSKLHRSLRVFLKLFRKLFIKIFIFVLSQTRERLTEIKSYISCQECGECHPSWNP